jgi:hypothetical protein
MLDSHLLKSEIAELKSENARLKALLDDLRMDPAKDAGRMAEIVVRNLVGGTSRHYGSKNDIKVGDYRIEVKYSSVKTPNRKTRRWTWSNIKTAKGSYHFLVLLGEKDEAFPGQYLDTDTTPWGKYVCFFIPWEDVAELMPEGKARRMIDVNTDRKKVERSTSKIHLKSKKVWSHMKKLEELPILINEYKSKCKPSQQAESPCLE